MKIERSSSAISRKSTMVNAAFTSKLQEVREKFNELSSMQLVHSIDNSDSRIEQFRWEVECGRIEKVLLTCELERLRQVIDNGGVAVRPRCTSADGQSVEQKAKIQKLKSELQKSRRELKNTLEERSRTIGDLSETNQHYQLQVEHLTSELNELSRQYKETLQKNSSLTTYITNIHLNERTLKEAMESLKTEHKMTVEFLQLENTAKISALTQKHREEVNALQLKLGQQIASLEDQLGEAQSKPTAVDRHNQEELQSYSERYRKVETRVVELEEKVKRQADEIGQLIHHNQNFLNQKAQQYIQFEDEKENLVTQFKFEQEKRELKLMEEYNELLASQEEQSKKVIHSLKVEISSLTQKKNAYQDALANLQKDHEDLQRACDQLKEENSVFISTLETSVREFEQQLSHYKSLTYNFSDLEVRFDAERSSYECKLQLQSSKIGSLENQLASLQQENRKLTEDASRLKKELLENRQNFSIAITDPETPIQDDQRQLHLALKKKELELADEIEKTTFLTNKLKEAETKVEHLKNHNFDLQAEGQVRTDVIESQKHQIANLSSKLHTANSTNHELNSKLTQLEFTRAELEVHISTLTAVKTQQELEYENLRSNLIEKDTELDCMIQRMKDMEQRYLSMVKDSGVTASSSVVKERETITTNRFYSQAERKRFGNNN
jgi:chromosome segregation ATPase